ncbi:MAG: dTDP-4-dehydrorhamnose reductase [Omnitrophica WOR_2 bacterium RIFCSPHIGHO2_02_FULL_67_20]|nr:MAG: dTDP-4-dehydrorhamnose reductase [Omnitrophica WOR_2 bacterium RIFCSPHIGHO2_02_FULL_67_20]
MKTLITGSTGLLGHSLIRRLVALGEVTGLSRHAPSGSVSGRHVVCDLLDAQRTATVIRDCRPDVVIHAQALSDVDACEREPALADALNVTAIRHVLRALEGTGALVVYVSTDYVFDGTKAAPYDERDEPRPISVYGRSKLAGERAALAAPRSIVVRTSTLFGPGRMSFCDHVVKQLTAGEPVQAFTDQVTSPTYSEDLADGLAQLSQTVRDSWSEQGPRVFHVASAGSCSRVEFARRVADLLGAPRTLVCGIPMAQQRRPALRPAYSALTTVHKNQAMGRMLRPWDEALAAYLRQRR